MKLVRGAWKLLIGIKDALVLVFMLLFFGALFAALSARPNAGGVHDGALVVKLDGEIVEQPEQADPVAGLTGAAASRHQYKLRDIVRALDAARNDDRVKAVVLDLDAFTGGYPAAISEVAAAVGRVRAAKKPVLAYSTAYTDAGYMIAANASEIWTNPLGGTLFAGPGGTGLYYKGLLDKLGVTAHVYRVGEFKSAVEPYTRSDMSPAARAANETLLGSLLDQWKTAVSRARPKARIDDFLTRPDAAIVAAKGNVPQANLAAGLIDRIGDRIAFGKRVAEIAGVDKRKPAGSYRAIRFNDWVQAHPESKKGDAIGVLTIAGEIVDGNGSGNTAGGDTIQKLLLDGLAKKNLKALVVRVDSPGGSALASEQMRRAILEAKAKGLPVVISMGGLAASGGYWVSTAGDTIFAEPNTITGSIGIFGILPTFEKGLAKIGVAADGVTTTPLGGQPDVLRGTNETFDRIMQAGVEQGYRHFIGLVAKARHMTPQRVDEIGQGRVWPGGIARQIGLVDRFGTLQDAIDEAARRAKLDPAKVHAEYLEKQPGALSRLIAGLMRDDDSANEARDAYSRIAAERRVLFARAVGDARRLATGGDSIQARCLECAGLGPVQASDGDTRLADLLLARLTQ